MEKRIQKIITRLQAIYPHPKPSLRFTSSFESLIATILSAQCTDERVNIVTKILFRVANTPQKILALGEKKLMNYVKSTGFYRAKTKSLLGVSKILLEQYNGKVPPSLEEMQKLPGVGRKTASVVLAQAFHIPAFPVDRHIFRVANRLSLAHAKTPDDADLQLRRTIPEKYWISFHLQLVFHGRETCRPKPKCDFCPLLTYCPEGQRRKKQGLSPFQK